MSSWNKVGKLGDKHSEFIITAETIGSRVPEHRIMFKDPINSLEEAETIVKGLKRVSEEKCGDKEHVFRIYESCVTLVQVSSAPALST